MVCCKAIVPSTAPVRPRCTLAKASPRSMAPVARCSSAGDKLFTFGVIADVQYADIPNGFSYHGIPRFYRSAVPGLSRAVNHWLDQNVQFALQYGDILDGYQVIHNGESDAALSTILDEFKRLEKPVWHMIGNHCLYNFRRPRLNQRLEIPEQPSGASYYSFTPHEKYRFVILDCYDISVLGWPEGHPLRERALAILEEKNPNEDKNQSNGMEGVAKRFVLYGGGASEAQLEWLREQLQEATSLGQRVIINGHLSLFPESAPDPCLLWNYQEVLDVLHSFPGTVVATFAGHAHQNGYRQDPAGIHHVVLPSVVEAPPGRNSFGVVDVYENELQLLGADIMQSMKMRAAPFGRASLSSGKASVSAAEVAEAERVLVNAGIAESKMGYSQGIQLVASSRVG